MLTRSVESQHSEMVPFCTGELSHINNPLTAPDGLNQEPTSNTLSVSIYTSHARLEDVSTTRGGHVQNQLGMGKELQ